jgi:hypothetical protein
MRRKVKNIAIAVAACLTFLLLVAAAGVVFRPPAALTAVEKRLVGNWNKVHLPDDDDSSDMAFLADRTFHGNDGQFIGTWWISNGQLYVKYHSDDWRENWSNWQPLKLWEVLRNETVIFDVRFVSDERIELAQPGADPFSALIRLQ